MKKYILMKVFIGMAIMVESNAAPAPYVPSYDDWYADDLRQAQSNKNYFIEPADTLNYARYCYLGAHAAERYPRFFSQYTLQNQTIPGMLYTGVRGLMISTYDWSLSWSNIIREGVSVVCSHPTIETKVVRKNGKLLYQTLHYEMNRIFNFLKNHPQAIITIFFEDYADIAKMTRDIQEIIANNGYNPLLKPSDYLAAQQKNEWPTLGWMRSNNKRLVLFTQNYDNHTAYTWPVKHYFWENIYGSIDEKVVCGEEKESVVEPTKRNRTLVSFGCFAATGGSVEVGAIAARDITRCLSYDTAKRLITGCQKRKFAQGKLFNAYWADRVIEGIDLLIKAGAKTVFDYINELNASAIK